MSDQPHGTPRRTVVQAAAVAAGAAGIGLAAAGCAPRPTAPSGPTELGAADRIPVGGAVLFRDDRVIVARPSSGGYRAFSAVCTHQGCVLASLTRDVASCPCHGSQFDALTGSVVRGPATEPLPAIRLTVRHGTLVADL